MIKGLLEAMIGRFWADDPAWRSSNKTVNYVVAKSGVYEIRENEIMRAIARPNEIKGINMDLQEGIEMKLPKIPQELYYKALAFMRAVYAKHSTESTIHFFWDREKQEYFLWVPKQTNTGTSSNYERDSDPEFVEMTSKYLWVMTAHSHPTFSGNFSSVDDADEKGTMLYMVVGYINRSTQDIAIRTSVNGKHVKLNFEDVFETPSINFNVPQEWLKKCTKKVYPEYSGGYYYNGRYYSGKERGSYFGSRHMPSSHAQQILLDEIDEEEYALQLSSLHDFEDPMTEEYYNKLAESKGYLDPEAAKANTMILHDLSTKRVKTRNPSKDKSKKNKK